MPVIRVKIEYNVKALAYVARCNACKTTVYMVTDEAIRAAPRRPSGSSQLLPVVMTVPHTCTADPLCPICRERSRDTSTRSPKGEHWCMPCQDEFDSIDWEDVAERRREMGCP